MKTTGAILAALDDITWYINQPRFRALKSETQCNLIGVEAALGWILGEEMALGSEPVVESTLEAIRAMRLAGNAPRKQSCPECGHFGCDGSCADYRPD